MSGLGGGNLGGGRPVRDPALGTAPPAEPLIESAGESAGEPAGVGAGAAPEVRGPAQRAALLGGDDYASAQPAAIDAGLLPPTDGMSEFDREIVEELFLASGVPNPYNANTTPALAAEVDAAPEFRAAVGTLKAYVANPTAAAGDEFVARMQDLLLRYPHGNVMEMLFLVFRESIQETNRDKSYFLERLKEYNKMGEALSDYLDYLTDRSRDLEAKKTASMSAGTKQAQSVKVRVRTLDMSGLDARGRAVMSPGPERSYTTTALNGLIKDCEAMQEDLRNRRQIVQTAFQNFDQKSNQLYNLLAQTVKTMNEMRFAGIKNLL